MNCFAYIILAVMLSVVADVFTPATVSGFAIPLTVFGVTGLALLSLSKKREEELGRSLRLFCPFDLLDLLIALMAYVLLQVIMLFVFSELYPGKAPVWVFALAASVAGLALAGAVLALLHRRYGLLPADLGIRFDRWKGDLLLAGGLLLIVLFCALPIAEVLEYLHEIYEEPEAPQRVVKMMRDTKTTAGQWLMIFMAMVAAPIWEEIMFRGFLQPLIRRYLGGVLSIVLTAVMFSLIHDYDSAFLRVPVMILPLALALGYAYHRTQRLAAPMMLHVLFNSISVTVMLIERASR